MPRPIIWYCLSLRRADERGWVGMSGTAKYCSFREITTKSSCVFGFSSRHISTAESLSDSLPFFPLIWEHSEGKLWCSQSQSKLLRLGDTRPAWLFGPFMETVLGLIIPSCASSPSSSWAACPNVLCNYAALTTKSRWDTQLSVHTHWACTDWHVAAHTEYACNRQCQPA